MKTFEETVLAMSSGEIIMAMVNALRKPKIKIQMSTFGKVENGICYGCAATNTICEIADVTFTSENIEFPKGRGEAVNGDIDFVQDFEDAIDDLRLGYIKGYNKYAESVGFAKVLNTDFSLPQLNSFYTEEQLNEFVKLAKLEGYVGS